MGRGGAGAEEPARWKLMQQDHDAVAEMVWSSSAPSLCGWSWRRELNGQGLEKLPGRDGEALVCLSSTVPVCPVMEVETDSVQSLSGLSPLQS